MNKKEPLVLTFPVKSLRKIPNPYIAGDNLETLAETHPCTYIAICDVKDVPGNIPMNTNPREQKLTTFVAKKIKKNLLDTGSPYFFLLNRGMLLSVKTLSYNNYSNELTISFEDTDLHGNVDGGHTYKIIQQCQAALTHGQQYVRIEILTGIESIFQDLAAARNTSVQVEDKSIAELENRFDIIKRALRNEPFSDRLVYKENDSHGDIDVTDILAILNMFNIDRYQGKDNVATASYSAKKTCIDYYINQHRNHADGAMNPYVKMSGIIPDIFRLYDEIECNMGTYYRQDNKNGKYGAVKGVVSQKSKSKFYKRDIEYISPIGFIYPILGAFRALLIEKNGRYVWRTDPFEVLSRVGKDLVVTTVERSRTLGNNPQSTGKDAGHWKTLYMTVGFDALK